MKKFLPLIVLSAFFFLPQSAYAGLSEGCFPIVQCDPGQDFYAGACKPHIETLTDCGVPPAGKYNAFTCDAGCYQMSYSVPGPAPICPGGIMVNGKCLIKLNVLDDMIDAFSVGNGAYKIWDGSKLTEVVHVGNAGCANNQIPVSDSTSPTGWKCGDGTNSGLWSTDGTNAWRPTGNVGVGVVAPAYKLDVNGATNSTQFCIAGICISAWPQGGGLYVGATGSSYNGNRGGYTTASGLCASAYTGSHLCSAAEMINSYNHAPTGPIASLSGSVWVNNGPPSYIVNVTNDCSGWKTTSSTIFGYVWDGTADASFVTPCNQTRRFACCL